MKQRFWFSMPAIFLWCALALGQAENISLVAGQKLAAPGSSMLRLETGSGASTTTVDVPTPAFRDEIVLDDSVIAAIRARTPAAAGVRSTLVLADATKREIKRFPVGAAQAAAAAAAADDDVRKKRDIPLADYTDCAAAAQRWKSDNANEWQDGKNKLLVLFNREARVCYESDLMPSQGDIVYAGLVAGPDDDFDDWDIQFAQCSRQPITPPVHISGELAKFTPQAGDGFALKIGDVRRCWDKEITLTATVKQQGKEAKGTRPVSFYERFRATLQLGALHTDLRETDFGLRDSGGQNIIYNKQPSEKGPEYVASLVVYGVPNSFLFGGLTDGYHGRDIINEHRWQDRTGLMLLAGLKDPSDRFGVGLSFELAYGINVFVAHQWYRQRHLVGVAEGDVFAGDAASITTKLDWNTDTSFGLSFDMRYLMALLKGQ